MSENEFITYVLKMFTNNDYEKLIESLEYINRILP